VAPSRVAGRHNCNLRRNATRGRRSCGFHKKRKRPQWRACAEHSPCRWGQRARGSAVAIKDAARSEVREAVEHGASAHKRAASRVATDSLVGKHKERRHADQRGTKVHWSCRTVRPAHNRAARSEHAAVARRYSHADTVCDHRRAGVEVVSAARGSVTDEGPTRHYGTVAVVARRGLAFEEPARLGHAAVRDTHERKRFVELERE
jgi:hypothetical protein